MGGQDSQKLRPWRGRLLLSGAQYTSGSLQNQHSNGNPTARLRGDAALPGQPRAKAQLQTAWVILGKHRWVTSRKRRSNRW